MSKFRLTLVDKNFEKVFKLETGIAVIYFDRAIMAMTNKGLSLFKNNEYRCTIYVENRKDFLNTLNIIDSEALKDE